MSLIASSSTMHSLNRLARAMVHMSQRVPTDDADEAKEFKLNQLRKSITGTHITQRPIQPEHRGGNITGHLLEMSTAADSHLALKRPVVIGCHSHRVLAEKNLSALDLHHDVKHCEQCAYVHQVRMTDVPLNPFSCWRRGHLSKKFGFLFNQIIQPTQHDVAGWAIGSERQIYTSPRLKLALQHLHSGLQVSVFPKEAPQHMGRSMVVVATVRWNMDASKETSRSISRVLDVQYLHSTNKQKESGQRELRGEEEKLYEFVKQFVNEVSGFWRSSAGLSRRNNLGVLSMAVVHCSGEDELEFLSAALDEVVANNIQYIPFEQLKPLQLQQLGLDDGRFQPHGSQFAICLFLDPMVDLVMEHV